MVRRILLKTFKIGNWYGDYYKHHYVQLWAIVNNKTDKIIRYGIERHSPTTDISSGYKTLEEATEVYEYYKEKIKKENKDNVEEIEEVRGSIGILDRYK